MTLRFAEGFELNAASSATNDQYLDRKMSATGGTPASVAGVFLGLSLRSNSYVFTTPVFASAATWIVHWWWKFDSVATTSQNAAMVVEDSSGEQISVRPVGVGGGGSDTKDRFNLEIKRGSTTLTTVGPFWAAEWHSFQFKVTVDPTNGAYELKVDDVSEASDAGPVNTANQGVANADRVQFSLDNGVRNMNIDHVVIMDSAGTVNNDFPGELIVVESLPNADGDNLDWDPSTGTVHNTLLNEAMPNNGVLSTEDPKRIQSETVGDLDRLHMSNLASLGIPSGTSVKGVCVETCARMEASGTRDLRAIFKDTGASTAEGASFTINTTAFDVFIQIWETNPATAASWTVTSVDAGQFGVKLQA